MESMFTGNPDQINKYTDTTGLKNRMFRDKKEDGQLFVKALAEYCLLYDVPFSYLVPDERYLPQESLRFFKVDRQWIFSLLDGACSMGRNTEYDFSHDKLLIKESIAQAYDAAGDLRPALAGRLREKVTVNVLGGFLMRSRLVSDYNGVEVKGYDVKEKELPVLRLEQLSPDILMGIFAGELCRVSMAQPKEALHLGIPCTQLRRIDTGVGYQFPELEKHVEVKERVLQIEPLAEYMKKTLHKEAFTSAELALELIQNAMTSVFYLETDNGSK